MLLFRHLALVVSISCFAAVVKAADDPRNQPQPPVPVAGESAVLQLGGAPESLPLRLDAAAGMPDLPENKAEIEALRRREMTMEPTARSAQAPAVDAQREARRVAFAAVVSAQDAKVQALTDRLTSVSGSDDRLGIQMEIEREKLATQRLLLDLQLDFAIRDGNETRINGIKSAIEAWDAPHPVLQPMDRPAPANPGR